MAKHKNNRGGLGYVIIDPDGFLEMYTETGHKMPCNIFIRVQDQPGSNFNTVVAKYNINIVGSIEEMQEDIKANGL